MNKLEITTRIGCKNLCTICPQDKLLKNYPKNDTRILSFDTFKTCVDKLPSDSELHFAGFCESYLNPDCTKMMSYAISKNFRIVFYTTLIGAVLEDIIFLKNNKFKGFIIHVPNKKYMNLSDEDIDNWIHLFKILCFKNDNFGIHGLMELDKDDKIYIEIMNQKRDINYIPILSRAGNLFEEKKLTGNIVCSESRYKQNILLPNGDVILCCQDWDLKHKYGNLLTMSYQELFLSNEYSKVINGLSNESLNTLCRTCEKAVNV